MNLNLDMVGEDTVKTNSRFYITRTPDSVDGRLNALMADVWRKRGKPTFRAHREQELLAGRNDGLCARQRSRCVSGLGIPATMLGHDPDWTHHTSEDTPDKTDASEFRRVGVLASAAAYWAAVAGWDGQRRLEMVAEARRLRTTRGGWR